MSLSAKGFLVALAIAAPLLVAVGAAAQTQPPVKSLLERREDRVVVQKWDLSCGAAALTTLLRYQHGDMITEREVALRLIQRQEYVENPQLVQIREGFSLLDLKRFVDGRGYEGIGYGKMDLGDLIKNAPILVPINSAGYNHFVVFRGVAGNRVLLADPAFGNVTMTVDKFERVWIEYGPEIGRVGFVVRRKDGQVPPNQLAPSLTDFVNFR
jgi:predicted double-glycine peptidase